MISIASASSLMESGAKIASTCAYLMVLGRTGIALCGRFSLRRDIDA